MNASLTAKVQRLREDYAQETGRPFVHFFCPVLFKDDEDTRLCEAHIVNRAFAASSSVCTVQRHDVDNFYGHHFEADFLDIQRFNDLTPANLLDNHALAKRFKATIFHNAQPIEYFQSKAKIPAHYTPVKVDGVELSVPVALRIDPASVVATEGNGWEIAFERDLRLHMLPSLIKAAYLTLFHLLGYRYALSGSGQFIGREILGTFFLQNLDKAKDVVLLNALPYFREFTTMVRPLISCNFEFQGSITDQSFFMCMGSSGKPWGVIVFVKTARILHGVLLPVYTHTDQAVTYLDFLHNDNTEIRVALCRYVSDHWEVNNQTSPLLWPKSGTEL